RLQAKFGRAANRILLLIPKCSPNRSEIRTPTVPWIGLWRVLINYPLYHDVGPDALPHRRILHAEPPQCNAADALLPGQPHFRDHAFAVFEPDLVRVSLFIGI